MLTIYIQGTQTKTNSYSNRISGQVVKASALETVDSGSIFSWVLCQTKDCRNWYSQLPYVT